MMRLRFGFGKVFSDRNYTGFDMNTLNVSLIIQSKLIGLSDLVARLGPGDVRLTRDKGLKLRLSATRVGTIDFVTWGVESDLAETAPLNRQMKAIVAKAGKKAKVAKEFYQNDVQIALRIAVFFDAGKYANAGCDIDLNGIRALIECVDSIEVSLYPCSD